MNENEEAQDYLKKLFESSPKSFIESMDDKSRGTFVLLKTLSETDKEVCAGDVSKMFGVSTARVAVVIKKLVKKGLVATATAEDDKRKVIIRITDSGRQEVNRIEDEMIDYMKVLVREVGQRDMNEFLGGCRR